MTMVGFCFFFEESSEDDTVRMKEGGGEGGKTSRLITYLLTHNPLVKSGS